MPTPPPDPWLGTKIRGYEILELLGSGGMGAVYKARHVYLDEERALKVIHSEVATAGGFIDRFIREARILSKLRSPHLVELYEFGTLDAQTFFMVMEFLRGESVLARLRRVDRFPVLRAINIAREAAIGLEAAHVKGIVHRDISPDNLLLVRNDRGDETTKVIDFGIAKPLAESVQSVTATNVFIGKLEYASPEQCGLLDIGQTIDRRSDIYSLGVTLYNMVTGQLPFQAPTPHGYILKHATEAPKPPSVHLPEGTLPAALEQLILRTLAKRREQRPGSMAELHAELSRIADDLSGEVTESASHEPSHPHSEGFAPGTLFARRYCIESRLGEGGMGAVYRALDVILEVPVALKVISPRIGRDQRAVRRLKREVILARKRVRPCRIADLVARFLQLQSILHRTRDEDLERLLGAAVGIGEGGVLGLQRLAGGEAEKGPEQLERGVERGLGGHHAVAGL